MSFVGLPDNGVIFNKHMSLHQLKDETLPALKFGTLFCSHDLSTYAWPNGERLFSCCPENQEREIGRYRTLISRDFQTYNHIKWHKHKQLFPHLQLLVVHQPQCPILQQAWERDFIDTNTWTNLKFMNIFAPKLQFMFSFYMLFDS